MGKAPVALQMYTLRDDTGKDFVGTLRKVAEIGYAGVEFAGYGGLGADEMKKLLAELNLRPAGAHIGLGGDLSRDVDYSLAIGNRYLTVSALPEEMRGERSAWLRGAEALNKAGAELKRNGLQLCYHNHAFEFEKVDGEYAYDLLVGATDPGVVMLEPDVFWLQYGGVNPVDYIRKYADRIALLHLKDMAPGPERAFAEVGEGVLDWDAIFQAAEKTPVQWFIVEQDICRRPALESVRISLENLKKRGIA